MEVDVIRSGDPVSDQLSTNHPDGGQLQREARLESHGKVRISGDVDQASLSQESWELASKGEVCPTGREQGSEAPPDLIGECMLRTVRLETTAGLQRGIGVLDQQPATRFQCVDHRAQ